MGKLVYFVFTGKDPDNLKPFKLTSLVTKATEESPAERFTDITEFEVHFQALKDLLLNQQIPIEQLTLAEVLKSQEEIGMLQLHQLLVEGNVIGHVYEDYISPVNDFMLSGNNLMEYYRQIGNGIRDFADTYAKKLQECYQTTGWPFREMRTFGKVLKKMVHIVTDEVTRLICLKQLWYLAFEADQWGVQKDVKEVYFPNYITQSIETQLAEYIISASVKVDMAMLPVEVPKVIRLAVIRANEDSDRRAAKREKEYKERYGESAW